MTPTRRDSGFSLIEVVIALAVLSLVVVAFYALITALTRQWASMEGQMEVQQQPRVAAGRIAAESRQARDFVVGSGGTSLGLVKGTVLTDAGGVPIGATTFNVEDASPLAAGRPIVVANLTAFEELTVTAISGTTVTISPGVSLAHKQGEPVRRAQSTLSAAASAGATSLTVVSGSTFASNDSIAVGNEGPFTVSSVSGSTLSITPALASAHSTGEVVQPLAVVFKLVGTQVIRCTINCVSNGTVLADVTNPPSLQAFSVVQSTLTNTAFVGDRSLCVVSVTGFAVNDRVRVDRDTYDAATGLVTPSDRATITSIGGACPGGTTLTVDWGMTSGRAVGTIVRVNAISVNLMTSQVNAVNQQTQEVRVTVRAVPRN